MRWRLAARVAGVGIALISAAAGVLLVRPNIVELPIAAPQGYGLLGVFLLVSAVLSLIVGLTTRVPSRVPLLMLLTALLNLPLLVIGFIELLLAGAGVLSAHYWLALLAIPGAGAFLSLFYEVRSGQAEIGPEQIGLTPEAGRAASVLKILKTGPVVAAAVLSWALVLWSIPVGVAASSVLRRWLLFGVQPTPELFVSRLLDQLWFAGLMLGLAIFAVCFELGNMIVTRLRLSLARDGNRLLSLRELGTIEEAFHDTFAYADKAHYPEQSWRTSWPSWLAYLIAAGMGVLVFRWFDALPDLVPDFRDVWLWFPVDRFHSVGFFIGTAIAVFLNQVPAVVLALLWPRYAERFGWWRLTHDDGFVGVTKRLVLLLRLHRLEEPFSAPRFLRRQGRRLSRFWIVGIALGAAATAFVSYHDRSAATLVRASGVDVVDWWTLRTTHYAFRQLEGQTLSCTLDKHGEPKVVNDILLPDGRSLELGAPSAELLDSLVAIDEKLRGMRVRSAFQVDRNGRPLYDPACVRAEAARFKGKDVQRLERLLHLDDWNRSVKKR